MLRCRDAQSLESNSPKGSHTCSDDTTVEIRALQSGHAGALIGDRFTAGVLPESMK